MSRPPIKLLVSDIDGTLVRKDKSLADATVAAVARLREAGVLFSLVSARPLSGMLEIARTLRVDTPIGAYNGGTVAHVDGTVVSAERLSADVAREAVKRLDLDWTTLWVFADGLWHTRKLGNAHDDSERRTTAQEPPVAKGFDDAVEVVGEDMGGGTRGAGFKQEAGGDWPGEIFLSALEAAVADGEDDGLGIGTEARRHTG